MSSEHTEACSQPQRCLHSPPHLRILSPKMHEIRPMLSELAGASLSGLLGGEDVQARWDLGAAVTVMALHGARRSWGEEAEALARSPGIYAGLSALLRCCQLESRAGRPISSTAASGLSHHAGICAGMAVMLGADLEESLQQAADFWNNSPADPSKQTEQALLGAQQILSVSRRWGSQEWPWRPPLELTRALERAHSRRFAR